MSNYPSDEFDTVPENSSRLGVHRSSLETPVRGLTPLVLFAVAALIIGLAAFFLIPKLGGSGADSSAPVAGASSASPSASQSPSSGTANAASAAAGEETTGSAASSTSAAAETNSIPATPAPETTSAPATDKSTPVSVLSSFAPGGMVAKYAGAITADGWTVGEMAEWGGAPQSSSVIFYSGPGQRGNAEALGALLGIAQLVDSNELLVPLAVVLGPDAQ
ncbi:LytR C-terminal domain-containing protein [Paenarthrobacter sp. Z7-10]|uniref:LytR C-terminal domain-containing protein n=1 Tax=Paenarthrobacter sp. Z7-10 TaxID=2787635 RepID=UPI0022A9D3E2|nr:LytR C-terminal domain-containing protein [Paenarthrobacter sp. Z7-10]MCZ2402581.1 LytR C-terminal domain-containing protein [Paenarthrobacter sp. Z7-10]